MRLLGTALAVWRAAVVGAVLWMVSATAQASDTRLLMFESPACPWCAAWEAEVGPGYPLSPEGAVAPLERVRFGTLPEGVSLVAPPRVTPTFVLIHDGAEIGRIEGYPGADFFWAMLDRLIGRLPEAGASGG